MPTIPTEYKVYSIIHHRIIASISASSHHRRSSNAPLLQGRPFNDSPWRNPPPSHLNLTYIVGNFPFPKGGFFLESAKSPSRSSPCTNRADGNRVGRLITRVFPRRKLPGRSGTHAHPQYTHATECSCVPVLPLESLAGKIPYTACTAHQEGREGTAATHTVAFIPPLS